LTECIVNLEQAVSFLRTMLTIRKFEERVIRLVNDNEIAGVTHEYIGQEAVAVGICSALVKEDVITSTHRGHGHIIAKGGEIQRMMAELFAKRTGYNKGRGGSMHIADVSLSIYGANGIVAAGAPIAMGAAWAHKVRGHSGVGVSFFGDGAVNQGVLHESMNMSALWKLPMLFVCENNGYAVTLSSAQSSANTDFADRASAYHMPGVKVDGMNVFSVYTAAVEAVRRARSGEGPSFLECITYRFMGHHTAEATMNLKYRSLEEIEQWKQRDPITQAISYMKDHFKWSDEDTNELNEVIQSEIENAVEFARQSEQPRPDESLDFMYATPYPGLPAKGWVE